MKPKPLSNLTGPLSVMLKINIALLIFAVVVGVYNWMALSNAGADLDMNDEISPSEILAALVGSAQAVLAIVLGVTFLCWIYRANKNLGALSKEPMRFSPGWSVGWYFIPIFNLFKPYQAMKEIWTVAHRRMARSGVVLGWWWGFWIVCTYFNSIAMRIAFRAEDAADYVNTVIAYLIADSLDIGLNVVALVLVSAIAAAYRDNYAGLESRTESA